MFNLDETPYTLEPASEEAVLVRLRAVEQRVMLLRQAGTLSPETVRHYYGEKRFEQVAESNGLEGSTLSAGETELAVVKGITITGHDPAYIKDALTLDRALQRVAELARTGSSATTIDELLEVHGLILGERPSAGKFRDERVKISGAAHVPPKTGHQVLAAMTEWQQWSRENESLAAPIRASVLHGWLTHIHPFVDGNGRTARAIGNLELIRAGYPPIIVRKQERDRYIEALAESDEGGDLRSFLDLVFDRIEGALTGLENSAKKHQGYDPVIAQIRHIQEQRLRVWQTGVSLLASMLDLRLGSLAAQAKARFRLKFFDNPIEADDFEELCAGRRIPGGWAFIVSLHIPGFPQFEKLAFVQHRSSVMSERFDREGGPSLFWSKPNPAGFPKWKPDYEDAPFADELTSKSGSGDEWTARHHNGAFSELTTSEVADRLTTAIMQQASRSL